MPKISRVEVSQVDLVPKVLRSDAIQAFSKQETPMLRIWTDDGMDGTGYSYTIGTGGSAVVALLRDYMAPWLLGRDAAMVEEIWKGLFFYTHANSVGATVSLALAAVDIALWDLRCRRARAARRRDFSKGACTHALNLSWQNNTANWLKTSGYHGHLFI